MSAFWPDSRWIRLRRLAAIGAVAWLVAIGMVAYGGEAKAVEYTVKSCDLLRTYPWTQGEWQVDLRPSPWNVYTECPLGIRFELHKPNTVGSSVSASLRAGLPVTHMRMTLTGGDTQHGVEYSLPDWPLPEAIPLGERALGDEPLTIELDLSGLSYPTLVATCKVSPCVAESDLVVSDFEYRLDDDEAPRVAGPWSHSKYGNGFRVGGWNTSSMVAMRLRSDDLGSGVRSTAVAIDSKNFITVVQSCEPGPPWTMFAPCPGQPADLPVALDTNGLSQGWHNLKVVSTDAVGNASADPPVQFGFDNVPPQRPASVSVAGINEHGWTHEQGLDVNWSVTGENEETATASGIRVIEFDIDPVDAGEDPPPVTSTGLSPRNLAVPSDGRWELMVNFVDRAGNRGRSRSVFVNRDLDIPQSPLLLDPGWISRDDLYDGSLLRWSPPQNLALLESGICGYSVAFGDEAVPGIEPNVFGAVESAVIPSNLPDGETSVRLRAVSCAGLASETTASKVRVDGTPPQLGIERSASSWVSNPVNLSLNASDSESGVEQIVYTIDGAKPVQIAGAQANLTLDEGIHTVSAHAVDRVGNRSQPTQITTMVDGVAPDAWFDARDERRPTLVRAFLADGASGIASAELQYTRVDLDTGAGRVWQRFGSNPHPPDMASGPWVIEADLPEESMEDGAYLVRVVVKDHAGNKGTSSLSPGGDLYLKVPLRMQPSLTAGIAAYAPSCASLNRRAQKRCKAKSLRVAKPRPELHGAFGQRSILSGEVRDASGGPWPGATLRVYEQQKFGKRLLARTISADTRGRYRHAIAAGTTRQFTVELPGTHTTRPSTATAIYRVRGSARVSARTARTGKAPTISVSGQLASGGANLPTTGKIVQAELWLDGEWVPALASMKTDREGRFAFQRSWPRHLRRHRRLRLRIALPDEDAWPYETGVSNSVVVRARNRVR